MIGALACHQAQAGLLLQQAAAAAAPRALRRLADAAAASASASTRNSASSATSSGNAGDGAQQQAAAPLAWRRQRQRQHSPYYFQQRQQQQARAFSSSSAFAAFGKAREAPASEAAQAASEKQAVSAFVEEVRGWGWGGFGVCCGALLAEPWGGAGAGRRGRGAAGAARRQPRRHPAHGVTFCHLVSIELHPI